MSAPDQAVLGPTLPIGWGGVMGNRNYVATRSPHLGPDRGLKGRQQRSRLRHYGSAKSSGVSLILTCVRVNGAAPRYYCCTKTERLPRTR